MAKLKRLSYSSLLSLLLICSASISAQWQKKPSTEWTGDDIKKVLNDSPWVKKLDIMNPSKGGFPSGGVNNARSKEGNDPSVKLNNDRTVPTPENVSDRTFNTVYVRLLSAKPVLEAIRRGKIVPEDDAELAKSFEALADSGPGDLIIIAVGYETKPSSEQRRYIVNAGPARLSPETIQETYLEVKGGQRLPLYAYKRSQLYHLTLGSFYIFKRSSDGKPVINSDNDEFRFHTRTSSSNKTVGIDATFKVKDLLFNGKPEF